MIPKSIRWRLPLSYAAIALLATVVLGAVLLTTLRGYYVRREYEYLESNARAIADTVEQMYASGLSTSRIRTQIESLSFLSQVRIRLLDPQGEALIESGTPQEDRFVSLAFGDVPYPLLPEEVVFLYQNPSLPLVSGQFVMSQPAGAVFSIEVVEQQAVMSLQDIAPDMERVYMPVAGTAYGFGLSADTGDLSQDRRSDQQVRTPIHHPTGTILGYVELLDGPAYGSEIVEGVGLGLLGAGAIAIVLAGVVGWFISQQISRPITALAGVTHRMAKGDLSARANMDHHDEIGLLGQAFDNMANRVEETVVALRRFVADAAHELQTPITALHANLELAANESESERPLHFIECALAQMKRLESLTNGLLQLSRIETGAARFERCSVDLAAVTWDTAELYASRAEQAGLNFQVDLPGWPVPAQVNEGQVRRALSNLLDNAIKFTPENGTVTIGVRRVGDQVELWVSDTGIGIPPEDAPLLFQRFHRGRNTATYPGNGLGLAIIKAIVEAHKGQVSAQSSSGGTRFTITLPLGVR